MGNAPTEPPVNLAVSDALTEYSSESTGSVPTEPPASRAVSDAAAEGFPVNVGSVPTEPPVSRAVSDARAVADMPSEPTEPPVNLTVSDAMSDSEWYSGNTPMEPPVSLIVSDAGAGAVAPGGTGSRPTIPPVSLTASDAVGESPAVVKTNCHVVPFQRYPLATERCEPSFTLADSSSRHSVPSNMRPGDIHSSSSSSGIHAI